MKTIHSFTKFPITALVALLAGFSTRNDLHAATMTDAFANRPVVGGQTASLDGDSTTATSEVGEPGHGGYRHRTVWGAWTAPGNGTVSMTTSNSGFDTVLAVYTGTALNSLLPVAQNNNVQSGFTWSLVSFPTKAGVTYSFAVDGAANNFGEQGAVAVRIAFTPAAQPGAEVGTDSFSARPALTSSVRAMGVCDTRTFTAELDEPAHYAFRNKTAWWRWTAPSNGLATIDTLGADVNYDTSLTVYVGNSLTSLSEVAINNDAPNVNQSRVTFRARAGQEYEIMVDGRVDNTSGEGNLILNLSLEPDFEPGAIAGFDSFSGRGLLAGLNARGAANNTFCGLDVNEPSLGSFRKHTVWWQWTAPADGRVRIRTEGSIRNDGGDMDTFLGVYTGASLTSLQLVANNNNALNVVWSEVQFNAQRGINYQIMVDGYNNTAGGDGNIMLSVDQAVPRINTLAIYPAVEVELPGYLGVNYQLQVSADLISWDNVGAPVPGAGEPIRVLDPVRGTNRKFYRYLSLP